MTDKQKKKQERKKLVHQGFKRAKLIVLINKEFSISINANSTFVQHNPVCTQLCYSSCYELAGFQLATSLQAEGGGQVVFELGHRKFAWHQSEWRDRHALLTSKGLL